MSNNFEKLEQDIAGDWLAIQEKIREDENREVERNSPRRMHCTFKEFYQTIYDIAYDRMDLERSNKLHEILRMVLSGSEMLNKGFERIWNVLCKPYKYSINEIECMRCGEKYDLLHKRVRPMVSYEFGAGVADALTIRFETIYCPKCSSVIGKLEQGTFINLTIRNIHEDRNMEEGGNDFKY